MMKIRFFLFFCLTVCMSMPMRGADRKTLKSPDGRMEVTFRLIDGNPYYELTRDGKQVVSASRMGFELEWRDDLAHAFVLKNVERSTFDEVWHPVWGEE
ncbi:MAG: glycoside hydrolase family 97 N-terminal domain-containing protein, partial [Bacteroidales bacterium]|nr:glycoside hydrolase family 97 N-terminal domain-containing protein [Bacteroidales bacterium]